MYYSNMVISTISIIAILCRAKHINGRCVFFENFNVVADICGYSFSGFPSRNKWERSRDTVIAFQSLSASRFSEELFKIELLPRQGFEILKCMHFRISNP